MQQVGDRVPPIPRWLLFVLKSDRAGSSWYVGTGFFFAPVLALVTPWPEIRAVLWAVIAAAGLWLGLLGVAMATGLAMVLRSGREIPEDYWRAIIDFSGAAKDSPESSARIQSGRGRLRPPPGRCREAPIPFGNKRSC